MNVQPPPTQAAVALATLVEQEVEHMPQWLTFVAVSTHVPPQSDCVPEQPETHTDPEHTGAAPPGAQAVVQPPQWLAVLVRSTQAPLQLENPVLQVNPHALPEQEGAAFATRVVHACPQVLQLFGSVVVSLHPPVHCVGVAEGHDAAHAYVLPDATHAGVLPLHACPQVPQLAGVDSATQAPPQAEYPLLHAKVHALPTQTAFALATVVVHALPQEPQLFPSLVRSTQPPLQTVAAEDGHEAAQA